MRDAKEQLQEDVISILEGFGVDETMSSEDYNGSGICVRAVIEVQKIV